MIVMLPWIRCLHQTRSETLYGTSTAACVLKLLGGDPATSLRRATARGIFGAGNNNAVFISDDTAQANTTGGLLDAVSVNEIHSTVPNGQSVVWINGSNIATLTIRGLRFNNPSATMSPVRVSPPTVANLGTLVISDVTVTAMGADSVVRVESNARVGRLLLDGCAVGSAAAGATGVLVSGAVADLQVRGFAGSFTGSCYLVSLNGAVAAATITRLTLSSINVLSTGGGLVSATNASHTLPDLAVVGAEVSGTAWLVDLNTTTALNLASVTHKAAGSGIANVRAAGNLTFRGDGLALSSGNLQVAAGGAVHAYSLGFPCDISKLSRDANALAANTNAALACGSGPVVCNGTSWKHLYSGATY